MSDSKLKTQSGFTLVEILIVIALIGVLAGLFVTQYPSVQRRSRDTQRRSDIKQYQTAVEAFANRSNGNFPNSGGTIQITLAAYCQTQLQLPTCPTDPSLAYGYRVNSTTTNYVIWSQVEQPTPPPTVYFVVCSNGRSGETTTQPGSSTCPTTGWL